MLCVGFAEHNAKQMAGLKSKVSTFKSSEARKRMLDLAAVAKMNPRMQSHFWFLESDLKDGSILKCDRSGKGLLQLLRHLKRFSEVWTLASNHGIKQ
jgi:Spindle and kinetochore-associated protein 1